jgi:hypothetical protein
VTQLLDHRRYRRRHRHYSMPASARYTLPPTHTSLRSSVRTLIDPPWYPWRGHRRRCTSSSRLSCTTPWTSANILPYNPRKPGEPGESPASSIPWMWLQFRSRVREVVITEHDEDICTRQLECAGMADGFDLPHLETLRVVQSPRSSYKPLAPRCKAFRSLKPRVISIVGHECSGHRHGCIPYLPVPSERLVFVQGIELDVGPWNHRPVPSFRLEQLYPAREHAQLRVEVIIWSLYAIAWNRNGIKRHGAARALKVLLGTDPYVAFSTVLDSILRAPVQSVELVFGKMAVGRAFKWDRSIGLSEFRSETLCEEFRSVCPPISEHEGWADQCEHRVTTMEAWVEQGRWKGVFTPREAERLPLD